MLKTDFYEQPTNELAKALLGKELVLWVDKVELVGRVVEVEAYHQDGDEAAHSFNGKTQRNGVMFLSPGHLYVYLSYGMHCCMNVVAEPEGIGAAVLIRALEPLKGLEYMAAVRSKAKHPRDYANGPGKACQAFAISRRDNGLKLETKSLFLRDAPLKRTDIILQSPRIGISKAIHLPWRYYLAGNPHVSASKWNASGSVIA
jgi:DNA-3-methyladenine glycosylase